MDGRLKKYHEVERAIIEKQLEILSTCDESSGRRAHWEQELMGDLEFVNGLLQDVSRRLIFS